MFKLFLKCIFICSLSFAVLFACKNKNNISKINSIDSLKNVLTSVSNKLAEIDSQKIYQMYKEYQNNSVQIKIYFNDKKGNGVWENITQYGVINDPLSQFVDNRGSYLNQIQNSKKQLENLKNDIENNAIAEKQFNIYFKQESDNIKKLDNQVGIAVDQTKSIISLFDTLNPKILVIIENLKKDKKLSK